MSAEDFNVFTLLRSTEPIVHPKATFFARMDDNSLFELDDDVTKKGSNQDDSIKKQHMARIRKAMSLGIFFSIMCKIIRYACSYWGSRSSTSFKTCE